MAVHVFPVESLSGNEKHLSMEQAYSKVLGYLVTRNQLGETTNRYMQCPNVVAVRAAVDEFADWSGKRPQDDPKLLWMRLHGSSPAKERPRDVGTRGYSAGTHFNWWQVFSGVTGRFPLNGVVVMDVCWGASPAAPAMMSGRTGNPTLLFGSSVQHTRLSWRPLSGLSSVLLLGVSSRQCLRQKVWCVHLIRGSQPIARITSHFTEFTGGISAVNIGFLMPPSTR